MIDLRQPDHDALRAVADAGDGGVALNSLTASAAITLAVFDLITVTKPPAPQRAFITRRGAAFLSRSVHA